MTAGGGQAAEVGTVVEPEPDGDTELNWWLSSQRSYWDAIADRYDKLYTGLWSEQENEWVRQQLSFISALPAPTVLDLGCGTGLGLKMVRRLNKYAQYIGVDVSVQMVDTLKKSGGADKLAVTSMEDLGFLADGQVNVVISLFSSVSYAYDTEAVIREISRVLAPDGHAYLSILSARAWSLLRSGIREGLYRTRGDHQSGTAAPVRRHTVEGIGKLCDAAGLTVVQATGMNVFCGLTEVPWLWPAGRRVAARFPNAAHTIEVLLRKKA